MTMTVKFWSSFAECEALVRPLLEAEDEAPFLNFDWLLAYWEHFGQPAGRELLLAGVFRDGELVTFAPLWVRRRAFGVAEVGLVGDGLSDYLGFAGEVSEEVFGAVIAAVSGRYPGALYRFHDIVVGSRLARAIEASTAFASRRRVALYRCLYRDLNTAATKEVTRSRKKFRRALGNRVRKLAMLGEVQFVVLDFDADRPRALAALPALFALHGLRHRGTLNAWCEPRNQAFLEDYLRHARKTNVLAGVLLVDGQPVAFHIGFRASARLVLYITAFHPAFAPFQPGHVNLHLFLEHCGQLGIQVVDFSKGEGLSKRRWTTRSEWSYRYLLGGRGSVAARLLMEMDYLLLSALVWGRRKRINYTVRKMLGRIVRNSPHQTRVSVRPERHQQPDSEAVRPFSYREVADLPLPALTGIVNFVYRHGDHGPLHCRRLPGEIRLSGADSGAEFAVAIS